MVMDYRERKPLQNTQERKPAPKNRPRKESGGAYLLLWGLVLLVTFGAGALTGWLVSRRAKVAPVVAVQQAPKKDEAVPATARPANEPLTFYHTLPAGGKGALGSGLNLKKPEAPKAPASAAPAAPPAAAPATPSASPAEAAPGRFVVQVASYRDRKEADTAQGKLSARGLAAYVVESKSADKGIWYRLRIGKHLTREEADDLAGTAGQGAMVLPE